MWTTWELQVSNSDLMKQRHDCKAIIVSLWKQVVITETYEVKALLQGSYNLWNKHMVGLSQNRQHKKRGTKQFVIWLQIGQSPILEKQKFNHNQEGSQFVFITKCFLSPIWRQDCSSFPTCLIYPFQILYRLVTLTVGLNKISNVAKVEWSIYKLSLLIYRRRVK